MDFKKGHGLNLFASEQCQVLLSYNVSSICFQVSYVGESANSCIGILPVAVVSSNLNIGK
jgi:hypothetical protein